MQNLVADLTKHFDANTADRFRLRWLSSLRARGVQWPRVVCDRLDEPLRSAWTTECVEGVPQDRAFYERAILRVTGFDNATLRSVLPGSAQQPGSPLAQLIHDYGLRRVTSGGPLPHVQEHRFSSDAEMLSEARAIHDEAMRRFRVRDVFDSTWVPDLTIRCMTEREQENIGTAFYLNNVVALNPKIITRENIGPIMYHEGVPGHHLQTCVSARARKLHLGALLRPDEFRTSDAAFSEGWALYVEQFWYDRAAYERSLRLRECRLVLDTGLHFLGWTRERAVQYLRNHCSLPPSAAQTEIDRYIALPAQALCYALGLLFFEHNLSPLRAGELLSDPRVRELLFRGTLPLPVFNQDG